MGRSYFSSFAARSYDVAGNIKTVIRNHEAVNAEAGDQKRYPVYIPVYMIIGNSWYDL